MAQRRPPSMRRRWDNLLLRWQARLDGTFADRVVPWIAAGVLTIAYFLLALARARSLDAGDDLASFTQAAWLVGRSQAAHLSLVDNHLLADQAPFAFYPLAWLTRILPVIPTLLAAQAIGLALGVVPLWRVARRLADLRVGAAMALVFAYAAYPAINNLNLADFHPEAIAVSALLGATYYGLSGRWLPFALLCVLAVSCRADLAIAVAGLGALLVLEGKRTAGIRTMLAAGAWALLAVLVIQPHFGDSGLVSAGAFARYGDTFTGVAGTMLAHPLRVLRDLVAADNLDVLILLLAPLLFLPVLAPRYLLPVLPLEALYLLADVPHSGPMSSEYTVAAAPFVFVAAAFAVSRMGRRSVERVFVDRRILSAIVIAGAAFFARDAGDSPYSHPWAWGRQDSVDGARHEAADLIPDTVAVQASPALLPLLAERRHLYLLPPSPQPSPLSVVDDAEYVVLDSAAVPTWDVGDHLAFREGLERQGFRTIFAIEGIELYKRVSASP